jgi:hypothetical protein
MATHDIDQINALVKRLDDLCREASKIREELTDASRHVAPWPGPRPLPPFTGPYDFLEALPTSADHNRRKNG